MSVSQKDIINSNNRGGDEQHFAFGKNWQRFLRHLTEERIHEAEQSLMTMLASDGLHGNRFLDIGSGSGLFSLAAYRLGAEVVSFDYDSDSVVATQSLRDSQAPLEQAWRIESGSVLDQAYMSSLGKFDMVYSWGSVAPHRRTVGSHRQRGSGGE